ncbi:MAG: hypothetical protein HLUCCA12_08280 [Rhodobacteraceae bacterium HLUCCA12]|nr:MAG: hypothetical protein HLUCCA12_08280 [Rhodobacteraceae bacterium HLUCCA12]
MIRAAVAVAAALSLAPAVPGDARAQTAPPIARTGDLNRILSDFLGDTMRRNTDALEAALRLHLPQNADSVFWPDADFTPPRRAVMLVRSQERDLPHSRVFVTEERVEIAAAGAGGPVELSLIRVQRFNLGPARRVALQDSLGADQVGPAAEFGEGPHVEWRFVMRPLQGMNAALVAAGRRELQPADDADCGPVACLSPDPVPLGSTEPDMAGDDTNTDDLIARLDRMTEADAWLIERGMGQDTGILAVALSQGRITEAAAAFPR